MDNQKNRHNYFSRPGPILTRNQRAVSPAVADDDDDDDDD